MNANRLINMAIRMVMRRLMRSGMNAGIGAMGKRGNKGDSQGQSPDAKATQSQARRAMKVARRTGRM